MRFWGIYINWRVFSYFRDRRRQNVDDFIMCCECDLFFFFFFFYLFQKLGSEIRMEEHVTYRLNGFSPPIHAQIVFYFIFFLLKNMDCFADIRRFIVYCVSFLGASRNQTSRTKFVFSSYLVFQLIEDLIYQMPSMVLLQFFFIQFFIVQ